MSLSSTPFPQVAPRRRLVAAAVTLLGAGLFLRPGPAPAAETRVFDAVNKAGRQRMLSQRLAKAWLALGQGIEPQRAQRLLNEASVLFERELGELSASAPTTEIAATYAELALAWRDYKQALLSQAPQQAQAARLVTLDARVLQLADRGTVQLERHSGKAVGRLVNIAGRERMLSQRAAKFYLLQRWKTEIPQAQRELNDAKHEFVEALRELHDAPEATEPIRRELALARQQWVFFHNALAQASEGNSPEANARQVFTTSENILQVMDRVTVLYASLA
ncbi:type IV pili methyl-accepting chemotaxis transducer N-terminal domain-containing protein [Eleftheria terrae]|uniref:type IV pili methyl-accepting chemotaxis transducer N-terminal domain-containing protein n=1 Tax=Eleftheria terrae TaxID=1597781 RepID=UPI00263B9C4E|nr:type IV pili methyl-accepting chemotaxis transducer N-terminal domain-containing protein [Eleftheria terrae]WKB50707.1 type IV pili methyl-accepting chemotaxis transducer N-terminal domain-containing protein [Eleftheria terrae]